MHCSSCVPKMCFRSEAFTVRMKRFISPRSVVATCTSPDLVQALRQERGYDYDDVITVSPDKLPNYEEKIKSFFEEHIHTDEVRHGVTARHSRSGWVCHHSA